MANFGISETDRLDKVDILIVGSGPIGAVFARTLVSAGKSVVMIDVGNQETRKIGDHKKNSVAVQKNISLFTNAVRGELHTLSVPTNSADNNVEPASWSPTPEQACCLQNGQNPNQQAYDNLDAAAASRVVGGMGSHWTCCTPREFPGIERSDLFTDEEWDQLYDRAEKMFWTNSTSFDNSIRQQLVKHVLQDAYNDKGREILSMPLACKRSTKNKEYVEWTCPASILGDLAEPKCDNELFEIRPNTQCMKPIVDTSTGQVEFAQVKDLMEDKEYWIQAKKIVVCAGAVLTAGILYNSDGLAETLPALGHYMTEQTMAFCQVVLKKSLVDNVKNDPYDLGWKAIVDHHQEKHPNDPLPFPFNDPDPQCYFPLTKEYPWHTQIHRDAFGYGEVPAGTDQRVVVDFRWFTYVKPLKDNYVEFSKDVTDEFGMPQPTFHYRIDEEDSERTHRMITDMVEVARNLGGFLPGAEPKYLPPGSALHITGTFRAGKDEEAKDSVVDRTGRVWGQKNLILGGCGVIPTQNACNPTLTAACFALAAADQLIKDLDATGY
ncbi:pyranose oxidase [Xylaria telfairii]|nr:pyranose oxidase [Xylaria telfairii]